jgi:hypothetical protein
MEAPMPKGYVFESPDGGKTIYRRTTGNPHRELYYEADEVVSMRAQILEDQEWHQIRQAAKTDAELAHMLDQAKMYWILSR